MSERWRRRSIRLKGYDYAKAGAYYVTICTHERGHIFGHIADGVMVPNTMGELAQRCWDAIPEHMPHVDIDAFVVMPNHVHGIVVIRERLVGDAMAGGVDGGMAGAVGVGADHDRPHSMPPPDITPPEHPMPMGDGSNDGTKANAPTAQFGADHDPHERADHDPHERADDERDVDDTPTAPHAQYGADHDPPLRMRPPTPTRAMPIVPHGSLGRIMRAFKSSVTRIAYRNGVMPNGVPLWQRGYYEHIIRDDAEYERIARYIHDNPMNLERDRFGNNAGRSPRAG